MKEMMQVSDRPFLRPFVAPALLVAIGLVASLAAVFQYSLRAYVPGELEPAGFTLANFAQLAKPLFVKAFADTVMISAMTSAFTLILAYPLAFTLVRSRSPWIKSALLITAITPLFLGEIVRTYSWIIVLGNSGFANSLLRGLGLIDRPLQLLFTTKGVVIALVHITLPVMVIMLAAAISHIDQSYERAAASLGAGPMRTFLTVTLPLSLPGIMAGVMTSFAWTFSAFATPQIIGGGRVPTISTLVYQLGFSSFNFPFAAALSIAGLVFTILLVMLLKRATRRLEKHGGHA